MPDRETEPSADPRSGGAVALHADPRQHDRPDLPDLPDLDALARGARGVTGAGVPAALAWAAQVAADLPRPGQGRTADLWAALATVAAQDLVVARVLEPHVDALAILAEHGSGPTPGASYGVWAAEGPGTRLEARRDGPDGGWLLEGRKPWCSLAGQVDRALVTAWVDDGHRGLFDVSMAEPGMVVEDGSWSSLGLADVVTSTTAATAVPAEPVGGPGWYLARDGFAWGGIGVAAVWWGGAVGLARRLREQATRREPDLLVQAHVGAVDAALTAARSVLAEAATEVDAGRAGGAAGALLAARCRQVVADAVEVVGTRVAHALGPGPLAHEPEHARRVADLGLYVRQHHAERDQAALGRMLLAGGGAW